MSREFLRRLAPVILAFVAGGVSVWAVDAYRERRDGTALGGIADADRFYDDFFNDDFFGRSRDPFAEMRRMQRQILNRFGGELGPRDSFDVWYRNRFGGDAHEITRREDGAFVYYDLDLGDAAPREVNVEVKDGQISVSGRFESREEKDGTARYHGSSFHRSFPVPPEVDGRDFKMEQEGRKIIIKFPKRAA